MSTRGLLSGVLAALVLTPLVPAQSPESDRDRDGLSDFHELHKYRTDPDRADTDGDGVPDGDWRERRECQYTVRTIVQVMRPVTPAGAENAALGRFLRECDRRLELRAEGRPALEVALNPGCWWGKGRLAYVAVTFDEATRGKLAEG